MKDFSKKFGAITSQAQKFILEAKDKATEYLDEKKNEFEFECELKKAKAALKEYYSEYGEVRYVAKKFGTPAEEDPELNEEIEITRAYIAYLEEALESIREEREAVKESEKEEPEVVFCSNCGKKHLANKNFCSKCGSELHD